MHDIRGIYTPSDSDSSSPGSSLASCFFAFTPFPFGCCRHLMQLRIRGSCSSTSPHFLHLRFVPPLLLPPLLLLLLLFLLLFTLLSPK